MTIRQRLQNPYALVAQGFVAGAILFFSTAGHAQPRPLNETIAPTGKSARA